MAKEYSRYSLEVDENDPWRDETKQKRQNPFYLYLDNMSNVCCIKAPDAAPQELFFTFQYFNKGAANIIFKILPWKPASSAKPFMLIHQAWYSKEGGWTAVPISRDSVLNKVLRVPRGKLKCLLGEEIISGFEDIINPLFANVDPAAFTLNKVTLPSTNGPNSTRPAPTDLRHHLLDHEAVVLFPTAMKYLTDLTEDGTFDKRVWGSKRSSTWWAMFLEDMSTVHGLSITLEIKPKWLLQSPNAPPDAKRCRTCAMQMYTPKSRATYICPLRLINGDIGDLEPWAEASIKELLSSSSSPEHHASPQLLLSLVENLLVYLVIGEGKDLLEHVRATQARLDPRGVLAGPSVYTDMILLNNLRAAMTLRDCSMFVRIPFVNHQVVPHKITSKLADLDFKAAAKLKDWAEKETQLRDGKYYTVEGKNDVGCWFPRL